VLDLIEPPWRKAREAAQKRTSFFAYLATLTSSAVFPAWPDLLQALATFTVPDGRTGRHDARALRLMARRTVAQARRKKATPWRLERRIGVCPNPFENVDRFPRKELEPLAGVQSLAVRATPELGDEDDLPREPSHRAHANVKDVDAEPIPVTGRSTEGSVPFAFHFRWPNAGPGLLTTNSMSPITQAGTIPT
jgi:hypothetical protein